MTAIKTKSLTKRYGELTAVSAVDMTVERGEIYGFLGPNGAGKSTTIALFLDYVRPTAGTARLFGLDPRRDHVEISRRVGVLPERCALYDRLSGRKHLSFAIRASDSSNDPDALLSRVGLDGAGDRHVGTYSAGMAQRLKLALALVGDPALLILDEPSSGLDPTGIRRLREIITEERDRGSTIFFSSHILEQVEAVCDRIGIMVNGQLVVSGELDELKAERGPAVRLSFDVERVPHVLENALASMAAVSALRIGNSDSKSGRPDRETPSGRVRIDVALEEDTAKAAVFRCVEEHTRVVDFSEERGSLETLFERYAREER